MEYENRLGMVITDFSMIKAGAFHRANGGYLILQARDLLSNLQAWEVLKLSLIHISAAFINPYFELAKSLLNKVRVKTCLLYTSRCV